MRQFVFKGTNFAQFLCRPKQPPWINNSSSAKEITPLRYPPRKSVVQFASHWWWQSPQCESSYRHLSKVLQVKIGSKCLGPSLFSNPRKYLGRQPKNCAPEWSQCPCSLQGFLPVLQVYYLRRLRVYLYTNTRRRRKFPKSVVFLPVCLTVWLSVYFSILPFHRSVHLSTFELPI